MKVKQINLNHCEAAQSLMLQSARENQTDVIIICEPFKRIPGSGWVANRDGKAAIWSINTPPRAVNTDHNGFVRARIGNVTFYSCYAPPSWELEKFKTMLAEIVDDARGRSPLVIAGDFNAWAVEWGSKESNSRGYCLLEEFSALDVTLMNDGKTLTYRKAGSGSIIDLTLMSCSLGRGVKWKVSEEFTFSDHQAIYYELHKSSAKKPPKLTGPKWKDSCLDEHTFVDLLGYKEWKCGSAENMAIQLERNLADACDASMPRRKPSRRGSPCYWWNDEINQLRKKCLRARRMSQRARDRPDFHIRDEDFRRAKRDLKHSIKRSKANCFRQICEEADINPWGTAYKLVTKKLKSQVTQRITCPVELRKIVVALFPQCPRVQLERPPLDSEHISPVTIEELTTATKQFGDQKTPGPDGIPNKVLKLAVAARPQEFADTYTCCLQEGVFPRIWKVQRLILLPKGDKPVDEPSSYRPICLLDTAGKILEKIIYGRLLAILEAREALSEFQFGFRKARSTVDAIRAVVDIATKAIEGTRWRWGDKEYCAVVTLDIRNAFNSASWTHILNALRRIRLPSCLMRIIKSYLSDRTLEYDTEDGPKQYMVTAGVPQGSVLGPLLWNVMYDEVLRLHLPERCRLIGFADDLALVVVAKQVREVEAAANKAIQTIASWLSDASLELAEHKTEAVLITSRKKTEFMEVEVGNVTIKSKASIKYLGVMLDNRLSYRPHIEYVSRKASKLQAALSRMLPNLGGPRGARRLLLGKVVASVALYAAPIWATALVGNTSLRRKLAAPYRLSALRVISGFRTVSDDAALVLANMMPVDLLAREMMEIHAWRESMGGIAPTQEVRRSERLASLAMWQARWTFSTKGRWTHRLVPRIQEWIERRRGSTNFHLTQFLTGHGGYREYLFKYRHEDSPQCPACPGCGEDPEHVLYHCPRYLSGATPLPPVEELIEHMMESDANWNAVAKRIVSIQNDLRRWERERREAASNTQMERRTARVLGE